MKTNELQNGAYKNLIAQFKTHLQTVNYSDGTIRSAQNATKDYLKYVEDKELNLKEIATIEVKEYFSFLEKRTNQKTGLGLSLSYLKKIKSSLQLFYEFLRLTQPDENYPSPSFPDIKNSRYTPKILTKEEVQQLFKTCENSLLGKRNETLLAMYYGCGLRRQEAVNLNVEDIDLNKGAVFIAKSKTHRQRFVFMSENTQKIVENYLFNVREKIVSSEKSESAFLVTENGNRMSVEIAVYSIKKLISETKNQELIQKKPSIHTLRHSIATHLLQAGMKLENIALFLGHRSLDSTQIYTHLSNENK